MCRALLPGAALPLTGARRAALPPFYEAQDFLVTVEMYCASGVTGLWSGTVEASALMLDPHGTGLRKWRESRSWPPLRLVAVLPRVPSCAHQLITLLLTAEAGPTIIPTRPPLLNARHDNSAGPMLQLYDSGSAATCGLQPLPSFDGYKDLLPPADTTDD